MILAAASSVGAPLAPPLELSAAFNPVPVHVQLRELAAFAESEDALLIQDAYGQGEWLQSFEAEIAAALGKEKALFFPTGVAAQNAALCVHADLPAARSADFTTPRPSFMTHPTSHLLLYEEDAYRALLGMTALRVGAAERPLVAADVEPELRKLRAVGQAPACVLVEVPFRELGCAASPWDELVGLRRLCDEYDVPLHMDGARLLEVAPFYAPHSLQEICALFDSVYLSFYKGLGAMTGAMLLGSDAFVGAAVPWRRRLGANPYTSLPYALSCRAAWRKNAGNFEARWHKLRRIAAALAARHAGLVSFEPAEPTCAQCICRLAGDSEALERARDAAAAQTGAKVFRKLRSGDGGEPFFEWTLGPNNLDVDDDVFLEAWAAFAAALES